MIVREKVMLQPWSLPVRFIS